MKTTQEIINKIVDVVLAYKPKRKTKKKKKAKKKTAPAIIIVIAGLFFSGYLSASTPRQVATNNQNDTTTKSKTGNNAPLAIEINPTPNAQGKSTNYHSEGEGNTNHWKLSDKIAAIATFAAFAQAVALIITIIVMIRSSHRQLRSYICISTSNVRIGSQWITAEVCIKNFGQTPAYDVRQWISEKVEPHPLSGSLPQKPTDVMDGSQSIIGAGDFITAFGKWENPAGMFIPNAEKTVYVYGMVCYKDAFNKNHLTKYRLICGGSQSPAGHSVASSGGSPIARGLMPDSSGNKAT